MARVGAFRGGPLRIGWVPLAIGGMVAAGAVALLVLRQRRPAVAAPAAVGPSPAGASQPAPRNIYGPTISMQPAGPTGDGSSLTTFPPALVPAPSSTPSSTPSPTPTPNPLPSGTPPPPASSPSAQQLYQVHPQAWSFAPGQTSEPIFAAPSWKSSPISFLPLGTRFAPTGPPVSGEGALTDLGQSSYYLPYQGGYISAAAATLVPNPSSQQINIAA